MISTVPSTLSYIFSTNANHLNTTNLTQDLRNHGDSPHATPHTYDTLAADVHDFLTTHNLASGTATLIGHSMGAKTGMTLALRHPSLLASLVAVDNAPVDAALASDFGRYVAGMRAVEEAGVSSQRAADEILQAYAAELPVRQFLLTNLERPKGEGSYRWRIPVTGTLARALDHMADFPFKDPEGDGVRFERPALFVRGTMSRYVPDEVLPIVGRFFPKFEVRDVESGHWVISENPEGFRKVVVEFLQEKE